MKRLMFSFVLISVVLMVMGLGCDEQDASAKIVDPDTSEVLVDINYIRSCMGKDVIIEFKNKYGETALRYGILQKVTTGKRGSLFCIIVTPDGTTGTLTLWDAHAITPVMIANPPLQVQILQNGKK